MPDAGALAASLAAASASEAAAGGGSPVVMAQAGDTPPVVVPEPVAPDPGPAPVVAEPAPARSEPIPPAKPQRRPAPVVADPVPPAEPQAQPEPVVVDPVPPAEPQTPPEPVAAEPVPQQPQPPVVAEPLPVPQPAPEAVAEPAPKPQAEPVVSGAGEPPSPAVADPAAGTPDAAALAAALAAAGGADGKGDGAQTAAPVTGQPIAPTPIEVDDAVTRSLEEALRQAAEARTPAPAVDKGQAAQTAAQATPVPGDTAADAAAAAAAAGAAPVAEALSAPATLSEDATAVVVTEGSARSASEDFTTRITEGLTREQQLQFQRLQEQLAAQPPGGRPVVVDDGSQASDDEDDDARDLAELLLAGVGGYVLANVLANNGQIALSTPDRVVVEQPDGTQTIIKDDNALLFQPGAQVTTEDFADGSSRTIVTREDGSRVVTIRDANLRVLRRTLVAADGTVTELIDDAAPVDPVVVADLPPPVRPIELSGQMNEDALREALAREAAVDRRFTLSQIRSIPEVRGLVAPIEIDAITFDTGSAAIRPDQAQQLATLGKVISDYVRANPGEVFLIEGHTDTVGGAAMNLALSDRRAESVALALSQYFQVPPENMVVQGYGERYLKVNQEGDVRANRRASVRRITDLLARS